MKKHQQGQRIIRAVQAAGGEVRVTAKGHLQVRGPRGIAIIAPAPGGYGHGIGNTLSLLRRAAGLEIEL